MPDKQVSKIGFGGARLGSLSNPLSMRDCARLLDVAIEIGITFFDTANIYGQGDSERLIGRAIRRDRDRFTIATKAGQRFSRKMQLLRPFKPLIRMLPRGAPATRDAIKAQRMRNVGPAFHADTIEADLEASLRRLGTDHVDLFLLHSPRPEDLADGRLFDVLARIRARGLARRVGLSGDNAAVGAQALQVEPVTALQLPMGEIDALRPQLVGRDIFLVARGIVAARGERDVRTAYADAVRDPLITTALTDTRSEARLRALAGLP